MKAMGLIIFSVAVLAACKSKHDVEPASLSASASTPAKSSALAPRPSGPLASVVHPDLLDPSKAKDRAPDVFQAKFVTTKGDFVVEVHRDWAPNGADRFFNLVKMGFYDDTRFFRAIDGFMVQFGISGDPAVNARWQNAGIVDDPSKQSNKRGYVTFAQRGMPGTRTTQIFINYKDNANLDPTFPAFGQVVQGMDVVDAVYKGYGEGAPRGAGPDQGRIQSQGNTYLDANFPQLDGVKQARIIR
jgi:peptidyl-prolyl cis-trans isomerase A (cyclophilin A)